MKQDENIFTKKSVLIFFFLVMLAIRLLYLDADPSFVKRVGDLSDEGIWVHNARTLFLFDNPIPDQATQSLSVTPLNSLLIMGSFSLFGVGLYQARLVSALAGWFTLVILYFFMRNHFGKKAAFISVLILGLNDTFFIYNRLAFGLVLPEMFILLAIFLWDKGRKNKTFYFLSGMSLAFAILSKLSAYYVALIFLILWLLQWYRKEVGFSALVLFGIGGLIPLIPYFSFLIINWDVLSVNFMILKSYYNSNGIIIMNLFRSFSNNLFGLPSMFLLIFFAVLYFLKRNPFRQIKELNFAEISAWCWLLVGFLSLVLLSDLSDRRFLGLLIPLSILSTKLYLENSTIDLNKIVLKVKEEMDIRKFWKNAFYSLLFSYPLVSFLISAGLLYFCRPISSCKSFSGYFLLIFFVVFISFLTALTLITGRFKNKFIHFFTLSSVGFILLLPFFTLLRHFSGHVSTITSTLNLETTYIFISSLLALIIMVVYVILSVRYDNMLLLKPTLIKSFFVIYFMVSGGLIGLNLVKPSFTLADSSRDLAVLGKFEVSGAYDLILSINAFYLPVYIVNGFEVNENYDRNRIKYFLKTEDVAGESKESRNELSERDYATSKLIKKIYLFPYPFTDKYRTVIEVYQVEGYTK